MLFLMISLRSVLSDGLSMCPTRRRRISSVTSSMVRFCLYRHSEPCEIHGSAHLISQDYSPPKPPPRPQSGGSLAEIGGARPIRVAVQLAFTPLHTKEQTEIVRPILRQLYNVSPQCHWVLVQLEVGGSYNIELVLNSNVR
jgi:hypothetical protein